MSFLKRKINDLTEDEFDKITLVMALRLAGWSYRKIGRVIRHDKDTVKVLYNKGLQLKREGKFAKNATYERECRLVYVGGTEELEAIERINIEKLHGKIK